MSWKVEVQAEGAWRADHTGTWTGNGLRFATQAEALAYASDLTWRWTAVNASRVVEVDEPANYEWSITGGKAVPLPGAS